MRSFFVNNETLIEKDKTNRHEILRDKGIKCRMLDAEFTEVCETRSSPIPKGDELICFPQQDALITKAQILKDLPASECNNNIKSEIEIEFDNVVLFAFVSDPLNWVGFAIAETVIHKHDKTIILGGELKFVYVKQEFRKKGLSQLISFYLGTLMITPLSQDENMGESKTKNISIIGTGQSSEYYGPKILEQFFWGLELESKVIDTNVNIDLDFNDEL